MKSRYGWKPEFLAWYEPGEKHPAAAALILQRSIPTRGFAARLRILYAPKGPLLDWNNLELRSQVFDDLEALARRKGAIFIKIDPDVVLGTGIPEDPGAKENPLGQATLTELKARCWRFSQDQIQFRNTVLLDLGADEEELLGRMKQKTRYNIRLAERKGVCVRPGTPGDFDLLYRMYAETSQRDGFIIRDADYYRFVWETFIASGNAEPLIAEVDGQPVAGLFLFWFSRRAWYLYGMSTPLHREKMPNYLLQWEAIRRAKQAGCTSYDLWGAPDEFNPDDSMWGVFRFKEGLGGQVVRTLGAWDLPARPTLYHLYTQTLPHLLDWMRKRARLRINKMDRD